MDDYNDGGYTRHNAQLGANHDAAMAGIAADEAAGRMTADAAAAERAFTQDFTRANFVFTRDGQEVPRAELFGE